MWKIPPRPFVCRVATGLDIKHWFMFSDNECKKCGVKNMHFATHKTLVNVVLVANKLRSVLAMTEEVTRGCVMMTFITVEDILLDLQTDISPADVTQGTPTKCHI